MFFLMTYRNAPTLRTCGVAYVPGAEPGAEPAGFFPAPGSTASNASDSGSQDKGGGFPVVAVAVPLAVGIPLAVALGAGLVAWRRRATRGAEIEAACKRQLQAAVSVPFLQ